MCRCSSQHDYNFTDSRRAKAAVKYLNTNNVPYASVQYKDVQDSRAIHSGDRYDSNISWVWQRSVCVWSLSCKNKLPAKRLFQIVNTLKQIENYSF